MAAFMNILLSCTRAGRGVLVVVLAALGHVIPVQVRAAATDLATVPLPTYVATPTKPNIMFILDDSGSMASEYMPDDMSIPGAYGFKSAQCNGVAYDPTFTYLPPVKADGSSYPNMPFTAAWPDGFVPTLKDGQGYFSDSSLTGGTGSRTLRFKGEFLGTLLPFGLLDGLPPFNVGDTVLIVDTNDPYHWMMGTVESKGGVGCTSFGLFGICLFGKEYQDFTINVTSYNGSGSASSWQVNRVQTVNLTNSTYYKYNSTGTQAKMSWTYTAAGLNNNTFAQECRSLVGVLPGKGKFDGVTVTAASAEAQNYANWYSYYRTRMLMMRTASGRAFQPLTNRYRVGFSTINDGGITESSSQTDITAGNAFLNVRDYDSTQRTKFFERLYNVKPNGGTPLRTALAKAGQYYAKRVSGQTYDPVQYACQRNYAFLSTDGYWNGSNAKQLDRTTDIGQQDAADVRPFSDGGSASKTTTTTITERKEVTTPVTVSQNWSRNLYTYASGTFAQCLFQVKRTTTPQTATTTATGSRTALSDWVTTNSTVVSYNAGVVTTSTSTTGPTETVISSSQPTPPSPTTWVSGTASVDCIGGLSSQPASSSVSKVGAETVTVTGTAISTTLSSTTSDPTTTTAGGSGGTANTLADVAEYYYVNDLRTASWSNCTGGTRSDGSTGDVCDNSQLTASGRDTATWQHMTTFTLGLGVNGSLAYDRYYLDKATDPTSTYYKLISGAVSWPPPVADTVTTIDDLWHTAVNGRGQYFGAKNSTDLTSSLAYALAGMGRTPGGGARPGTSLNTPNDPLSQMYSASYTTVDWTGNLMARTVASNAAMSDPLAGTGQSAVDSLAARGSAGATNRRKIWFRRPGTTTLYEFTYDNLGTYGGGLASHFTGFCGRSVSDSSTVLPQQCASLSPAQLTLANNGTKLVEWLAGSSEYEESNAANPIFRGRVSALGDIVNSSPVYVGAPMFDYSESGYAAFKLAKAPRQPVVYVGANDGMLHAFAVSAAGVTKELWAYVPTAVMPKLYRLANTDYANYHQYFVDGSPVVADVRGSDGNWRTILVGGLNGGGKSYYALDVTDPAQPKVLWEMFESNTAAALGVGTSIPSSAKDADLGYTFGNPLMVRQGDGKWVVMVTSGYNNTTGTTDGVGKGHLYVLDPLTGTVLKKISTSVGSAATPSGLGKILAWVDSPRDNIAKRVYGGDLLGNVWRFDLDSLVQPYQQALRLAQLQVNASTPQPITARPELYEVTYNSVKYPVVLIATGRYLGTGDLSDTTVQSIYAIKDPLTNTELGDLYNNTTSMVVQDVTTTGTSRTSSAKTVNWANVSGWRINQATPKERVFANMEIASGALLVSSIIPGSNTCSAAAGGGYDYTIDITTGAPVPGAAGIGVYRSTASSGIVLMGNDAVGYGDTTGDTYTTTRPTCPTCGGTGGSFKRASWRELINNK